MLVRTAISLLFICLGPAFLVAVMTVVLLARRRRRLSVSGHAETARVIVGAAVLATAFVTIGVLIQWR